MSLDEAFADKLSLRGRLSSLDKSPVPFGGVSRWDGVQGVDSRPQVYSLNRSCLCHLGLLLIDTAIRRAFRHRRHLASLDHS